MDEGSTAIPVLGFDINIKSIGVRRNRKWRG